MNSPSETERPEILEWSCKNKIYLLNDSGKEKPESVRSLIQVCYLVLLLKENLWSNRVILALFDAFETYLISNYYLIAIVLL